jgi:hypothetical protein
MLLVSRGSAVLNRDGHDARVNHTGGSGALPVTPVSAAFCL